MFKKIITLSFGFSAFSFIPIALVNNNKISINQIHYSNAIEKTNSLRNKIDKTIETLTEILHCADNKHDIGNDAWDSKSFKDYIKSNDFVIYKNECCGGDIYNAFSLSNRTLRPAIYQFYGEKMVLNPHYITYLAAYSHYVGTGWSGYSWDTIIGWFADSSVEKTRLREFYGDRRFEITDINNDVTSVTIDGSVKGDKPSGNMYLEVNLKSSETGTLLNEKYEKGSYWGWVAIDAEILYGKVGYALSKPSVERLENMKRKIIDLKNDMNIVISNLNNYDERLDYNVDYEYSNLKQILDNGEQLYNRANAFIELSASNHWIQPK